MNALLSRSRRGGACAALVLAAGLAAPAAGIDRSWTCAGGAWTSDFCWSPVGRPGNADVARFGDLPGVQNVIVHLDANEIIAGLDIRNGMTFDTDNFTLDVNGHTSVSGRNTVGSTEYRSRLRIDQAVDGPDFMTNTMSVLNDARVTLNGGGIRASGLVSLATGTLLDGSGTVVLDAAGTSFVNNGTITPAPSSLSFAQTNGGRYDLDGNTGDGHLNLDSSAPTTLAFQGVGLNDSFSGRVTLLSDAVLAMNLSEGWAADSASQIDVYGSLAGGPSRIAGSMIDFAGTYNLYSGADLSLEADITFQPGSEMVLGINAFADISGDAVINGGLFTLFEDANVDFQGRTELNAGTFLTFGNTASGGAVDFNGDTYWAGTVAINGIARQYGPATVSDATVIDADTFDMDGGGTTVWTINDGLSVNANRIDSSGSDFSGTLDIGGGLFSRLTVNLDGPDEAWIVSGTMNLAGNPLLFFTRIGDGSPLLITGDVNVSGRADIATGTNVLSSASINLNAANSYLRFMSSSLFAPGVTFTGAGTLQNGGLGDMTLSGGLSTGPVGLINTGTLRIGSSAATVSVDRFQNSGTWAVQIGGHAAGAEYDRLIVSSGSATLDGSLQVELVDLDLVGGAFEPAVGDTFTILTAVGGVSGAFAPGVTSMAGGATYHWTVLVHPNEVTLRLDSIVPAECSADFNDDGFVNSQDFFDFLVAFFAGHARADFNADAFVNSQDYFDFLTAFFSPC